MKYKEIIHNEHFNNLATILNVAFHLKPIYPQKNLFNRIKAQSPFWILWKEFDRATSINIPLKPEAAVVTLTNLLVSVTTAAPELLWYTKDDLTWFCQMLDGDNGAVMVALFKAWVSAHHQYLTAKEVAALTNTSESNWRNRASGQPAFRAIPGCRKPGKDWLIPLVVLQAQGEIPWSYTAAVYAAGEEGKSGRDKIRGQDLLINVTGLNDED